MEPLPDTMIKRSRRMPWAIYQDNSSRTIDDPVSSSLEQEHAWPSTLPFKQSEITLEKLHKSLNDFRLVVSTCLTRMEEYQQHVEKHNQSMEKHHVHHMMLVTHMWCHFKQIISSNKGTEPDEISSNNPKDQDMDKGNNENNDKNDDWTRCTLCPSPFIYIIALFIYFDAW